MRDVLAELQAKGVRADIIDKITEAFELLAARREHERQRQKKRRQVSRDTTRSLMKSTKPSRDSHVTPSRDTPKTPRGKRPMPADWHPIIAEKDRGEFLRFTDYCTAHAKRYANWDAAWRNWKSSPYRKPNGGAQNGRRQGSLLDVTDRIEEYLEQAGIADDYIPETGQQTRGVDIDERPARLQRLSKG
jgi:hypothetical protein